MKEALFMGSISGPLITALECASNSPLTLF